MKIEARVFLGLALFMFVVAAVYGWWTYDSDGEVEAAGTAALILSGGLMFIAGSFFWFVSRRIEPRPEDRGDAEIAEGAGELGFFSPHSYWPFGIALSAAIAGVGFAFVQAWLIAAAGVGVIITVGGLVFEYYVGGRRSLG